MLMSSEAACETDACKIDMNRCPVCDAQRRAKINPRRALQEHLRTSKDPAHVMWRMLNYGTHFKRGGDRVSREHTAEEVLGAVTRAFGAEWAARTHIH